MDTNVIILSKESEKTMMEEKMKLTKKLGPAEIQCRCIVIPRGKKGFFPQPGTKFDLAESNITHKAMLDKQFRLRAVTWFRQHRNLKPGDEVTFLKENGKVRIMLSKNFADPNKETIEWAKDVLQAIGDDELPGRIRFNKNGFSVEIGPHIKRTEVFSRKGLPRSVSE